jgi:hypothetical protein
MEEHEPNQPPDVITSDTDNATVVDPKEAPPQKRAKFRRFRAYNRGIWNGPKREDKEVSHRQDNLHRYDSISSTLGLTDFQKSRGRNFIDSLDLGSFNKGSEGIDEIAFCVCVVVVNMDNEGTRYWPHPQRSREDNDELFVDFSEELDFGVNDQMSLLQRVKSRLPV